MWWTTPPRRYLNGTSLTRPLGCCAVGPSCAFSLFPWKTLSLLYFTLPVSAGDITHLLPAYLQHAITIHLLIRHITVVVTVHCLFLLVNTARFLLLPSTGFHLPIQVYFALSLSLSLYLYLRLTETSADVICIINYLNHYCSAEVHFLFAFIFICIWCVGHRCRSLWCDRGCGQTVCHRFVSQLASTINVTCVSSQCEPSLLLF